MLSTLQPLWIPRIIHRHSRIYSTDATTEKLIYPEPRSSNHHDLPSFLKYASRINLDPTSTVYVGTHYEYTVLSALERLGMSLKRIGGASDYGIDLLGTWSLPSVSQPLKVLIQCKVGQIRPAQTRELEGAFTGAPPGWRGAGLLALLVSQTSATKAHREALGRSRWPMGYVFCKSDGKVMQMLWNRKAEDEGLAGISVETMYTGGSAVERVAILTWKGQVLNE
jgi:hypothetical protein